MHRVGILVGLAIALVHLEGHITRNPLLVMFLPIAGVLSIFLTLPLVLFLAYQV